MVIRVQLTVTNPDSKRKNEQKVSHHSSQPVDEFEVLGTSNNRWLNEMRGCWSFTQQPSGTNMINAANPHNPHSAVPPYPNPNHHDLFNPRSPQYYQQQQYR